MAGSALAEEHYLVGGCTASGWNAGEDTRSAVAMMNVSENTWIWCGKITVGEGDNGRFKIPNGAGSWDGYWAPEQGTVLTSEWSDLSTSGDGDKKYCVSEEGIYKVTINTNTLKIKAEKLTEPTLTDGYYQLGTVEDYYWFAGAVTSGQQNLKVRLTADLDFSEKGFFTVGSEKIVNDVYTNSFKGEFDGQGHTMSGIDIKGSYNKLAPFRSIDGATIKNLRVDGTIETNNYQMGGLVALSRGGSVIQNVLVNVNLKSSHTGDGTHGGVIAVAHNVPTVQNVAFVGSIDAPSDYGTCGMIGYAHSGGDIHYTNCFVGGTLTLTGDNNRVFGRNGEYCTNCYTTLSMTKLNNADRFNGSDVTDAQVASGELAYKLNGNSSDNVSWYQVIGTDTYPIPFGTAVVYANGNLYCDGTSKGGDLIYSNTNESVRDAHVFNDWGFCSYKHDGQTCNEINTAFMTPATDGFYEIGTKEQLNWFAVRVNGHNTYHSSTSPVRNINGRLTDNIDFSGQTNMIGGDGNSAAYQGTFDGQGYKVTVDYNISEHNVALFRTLASAHIMNLVTDGTIRNEGNNCSGGIFAGSHGASVVENCVSYVALSRDNGGDATFGGIGAYMHDNGSIKNCAFYGSIETPNATGNGGLLGYANGGSNIAIENCIVNATAFTFSGNSVSIARNTGNVKNTYVVNAGNATQNEQKTATSAQVASGELAYIINRDNENGIAWYQKLGDEPDAAPLPFGTYIVYLNGDLYCDGMSKGSSTYSNTEGQNRDSHFYGDWGLCTKQHDGIVCDDANPNYVAEDGGFYMLSNKKELNWFALFVNQGKGDDANAKLTDDIDMEGVNAFPGIGNNDHRYAGTLDGQRHKISNLVMNWAQQGVGLVSRATAGVEIKNLTIDASCSFTGTEAVAAFIGGTYGTSGTFVIENCGNEAAVNATSKNAGAFLGCNYASDQSRAQFLNCYNTGAINSTIEGGAFSGWAHKAFVMTNCYNTGALSGCEGFARGYEQIITNCWSTSNNASGTYGRAANNEITDITDGTVFVALFDADNVWRMDFNATTPHPVLYDVPLVLDENFPNRFVAQENASLTLKRSTVADTWNTICLPFALTAAQIKEVFGEGAKVAALTGAEGETMQFTSTDAIVAGKAYLVKPTTAITKKELTSINLVADAPVADEQGGFAFTGIYEPTMIAADDLFVASGNKLQPSDGTGKLKGFRAYFAKTQVSTARATSFVIDGGETTGIIGIDGTVVENGSTYTLGGQRVAQPTKGLYIVNGKKVVIK